MQILNVEQNTEAWAFERKGRITGSKLGAIVTYRGNKRKIGVYQLVADRLGLTEEAEDESERGHRLEQEAVNMFEAQTGKSVARVGLCISDKNNNIALSPDGLIGKNGIYKEAVEIKCLGSARHLQAWFEKEIPSDYEEQVIQYFIVNEQLNRLYFCFYDPRIAAKPFFYIIVEREQVADKIRELEEYQVKVLNDVDEMVSSLVF